MTQGSHDDPIRSRTYGIQQDGVNTGSVVVLDPLDKSKIACVTVGKKPADLAVSADGSELLVINCVDETLTAINLATLRDAAAGGICLAMKEVATRLRSPVFERRRAPPTVDPMQPICWMDSSSVCKFRRPRD